MMTYRIEWRPMSAEAPKLALCKRFANGSDARHGALLIAASNKVDEFAIATLSKKGRASARVLTNVAAIIRWDPAEHELPDASTGEWSAHIASSLAGAQAFAQLEHALNRAWQAGTTGRSETAGLIREARRLLDDDDEGEVN